MLEVTNLVKQYETPAGPLPILDGVNLKLLPGDAIAVMGPSGSGKSTLLYILGALDAPTSGSVRLSGQDPFLLKEAEQAAFRNKQVGFLFQDHCLLPRCSVLENVLIPTLVSPGENDEARARTLLDQVGLGARLDHRPAELSGGEKQRAALARALIRDPLLLLCDEPTGNLDQESAGAVADLLFAIQAKRSSILIAVTHSPEFAAHFPKRYHLRHRKLEEGA
jgi:lipoprotein-releasing system ATP-binding protein